MELDKVEICVSCGAVVPPNYTDMPHFSPREHAVYVFIAKHPECTLEWIVQAIYSGDPNGGPTKARNAILAFICFINKKLHEAKIDHRIVNTSRGYPARYRLAPISQPRSKMFHSEGIDANAPT